MADLIDIFLQPSKLFSDLKHRPSFMLPLVVVALLSAALVLLYFTKVDPIWYLDHTLAAAGDKMSEGELAQAKKLMPGARVMGYIGSAMAALSIVLVSALYSLYFLVAGKITGTNTSFKQGLSLISWANMPLALGSLVALIGVLTMAPQTSLESLMLTNVDPLLMQLPTDSPWVTLARNFSLLNLWAIFLVALGWRLWGRTSWTQAMMVAVLPSLLIYGGMIAIALTK